MERITGNPSSPTFRIGTITVPAGRFTRHYECAAWYQTLECGEQTVELLTNGYYLSYKVEGEVVDSNFQSLLCGVAVGDGSAEKARKEREHGKRDTHVVRAYSYSLHKLAGEVNLDPKFATSVEVIETDDGRSYEMSRIWRKGE